MNIKFDHSGGGLRLLDTNASEIAKICVLWTFWPKILVVNDLLKLAKLQPRMSRGRRFLLFLKHKCLVTLSKTPIFDTVFETTNQTTGEQWYPNEAGG